MKVLPILSLCVLVLAGCGGPAITAKKATFELPNGFTKGESEDGKVVMAIPSGWRYGVDRMTENNPMAGMLESGNSTGQAPESVPQGDPQASDAQQSIQALQNEMARISKEAEEEELAALAKKGIIFHAIGGAKPVIGEERTRFYVKKIEQGGNWSWEAAERSERDRFLHKPKWAEIDLKVGKAHWAEESRQQIDGSNFTVIVYLVIDGNILYSTRFITQESPDLVKTIHKPVMETFTVQ